MEGPTSSWGSRNRITCLTLQEHDDDDDDEKKKKKKKKKKNNNNNNKRKKKKWMFFVMGGQNVTSMKAPRLCPIIFLVKLGCGQGEALGWKEDKVIPLQARCGPEGR